MEKLYRVQREALHAEMWQWIKNVVRRLFRLPITKTSDEVRREYLEGRTNER